VRSCIFWMRRWRLFSVSPITYIATSYFTLQEKCWSQFSKAVPLPTSHSPTADLFSTQNFVCSSGIKLQKGGFTEYTKTSFVDDACSKAIWRHVQRFIPSEFRSHFLINFGILTGVQVVRTRTIFKFCKNRCTNTLFTIYTNFFFISFTSFTSNVQFVSSNS
jgi:hypothetical protein